MTNTNNATTGNTRRIPLLRGDQAMLYDAIDGFIGYIALDEGTHRIKLARKPTSRSVVFDLTSMDDAAFITGTVFQTETPGALGKTGKPLPHLNGRLTVAGPIERTFSFAVWHMIAASGSPYYFGLIKPIVEEDSAMAAGAIFPARGNVVTLTSQPAQS